MNLPNGVAAAIASIIASGLGWEDDAANPSCLLVVGERICES
jgi:hypothetical protein